MIFEGCFCGFMPENRKEMQVQRVTKPDQYDHRFGYTSMDDRFWGNTYPHTRNSQKKLWDAQGRKIDYLRLSVTDRCNLRCSYCMPPEGVSFLPDEEILHIDELLAVADLYIKIGVRKIRITGGEPLLRRDILPLLQELGNRKELKELTITTNGTHLSENASALKNAGIGRVNVSLDSTKRETFAAITGKDLLDRVIQGILDAKNAGLKIKINTVVIRGRNDGELFDIIDFCIKENLDVRFIEVMPNGHMADDLFLPVASIKDSLKKRYSLLPHETARPSSTAEIFTLQGHSITVGFISPLSRPFCSCCNKVRVTSDGKLKTCLLSDSLFDLKSWLRNGVSTKIIERKIIQTVYHRPAGHRLWEENSALMMSRVGG
jgi:cyclic pyranopterin phosphate synthase